jgi:hypothetical protein
MAILDYSKIYADKRFAERVAVHLSAIAHMHGLAIQQSMARDATADTGERSNRTRVITIPKTEKAVRQLALLMYSKEMVAAPYEFMEIVHGMAKEDIDIKMAQCLEGEEAAINLIAKALDNLEPEEALALIQMDGTLSFPSVSAAMAVLQDEDEALRCGNALTACILDAAKMSKHGNLDQMKEVIQDIREYLFIYEPNRLEKERQDNELEANIGQPDNEQGS